MGKDQNNKVADGSSVALGEIEEAHRRFLGSDAGDAGVLEPLPAYPDLCTQPPARPAVPSVTTYDAWPSDGTVVSSQDAELATGIT